VLWATAGDAKVDERRSGDRVGVSQYPRIRGFSCSAELLTLHWDACLWQVQLETFGAATVGGPTMPEWRWDVETDLPEPAFRSISLSSTVRRRLDIRYRVETCILATKRLEILSEEWRNGGNGRVQLGRVLDARVRRRCTGYMKYAENGDEVISNIVISVKLRQARLSCLDVKTKLKAGKQNKTQQTQRKLREKTETGTVKGSWQTRCIKEAQRFFFSSLIVFCRTRISSSCPIMRSMRVRPSVNSEQSSKSG